MSKAKKKTASKEPQSPSGRPAGSVTSPCEPVKAVPAMCRKCHSANLLRKCVVRDAEHFSEIGGVKTTRRRWTRAMCRACGQWQTIIEEYNP